MCMLKIGMSQIISTKIISQQKYWIQHNITDFAEGEIFNKAKFNLWSANICLEKRTSVPAFCFPWEKYNKISLIEDPFGTNTGPG